MIFQIDKVIYSTVFIVYKVCFIHDISLYLIIWLLVSQGSCCVPYTSSGFFCNWVAFCMFPSVWISCPVIVSFSHDNFSTYLFLCLPTSRTAIKIYSDNFCCIRVSSKRLYYLIKKFFTLHSASLLLLYFLLF